MPDKPSTFQILKKVDMSDPKVLEKERLHPGHKSGTVHGSYISDLAALYKTIVLCYSCSHKFDHKKYRYYMQREFPFVLGKCDACKNFGKGNLYLHQSEAQKCWDIKHSHEEGCKTPRWLE